MKDAVIPAKAGIQATYVISNAYLDSRLRGNDKIVTFLITVIYASRYYYQNVISYYQNVISYYQNVIPAHAGNQSVARVTC